MNRSLFIRYTAICLMLFSCMLVLMPHGGFRSDIRLWKLWAEYGNTHGLGNVYGSNSNYLPLYHYILYLFTVLIGTGKALADSIYLLKGITLIFHFITGYYFIRFLIHAEIRQEKIFYLVLYYLLNIAVLYNSLIWGQVDAIMTCFIFASVYFAYSRKGIPALLCFVLAVNMKLQAIIFLPMVCLLLLPVLTNNFSFSRLLKWLICALFLQFCILLPFLLSGNLDAVLKVVAGSVGHYPVVSMNAYNIWEFLLKGNLMQIPDNELFFALSYKTWGLLLFFLLSILAMYPLLKEYMAYFRNRGEFYFSLRSILIVAALLPLIFFFFNTQMHERYSHPAIVFLILYAVIFNRGFPAILGSIAYFLNLEAVFKYLKLGSGYSIFIFDRVFIASLFLVTILLLYLDLFGINRFNGRQSNGIRVH